MQERDRQAQELLNLHATRDVANWQKFRPHISKWCPKSRYLQQKNHIYLKKCPSHCCVSGSALILLFLDPYPNWDCGSGSRSKEIDQNKLDFYPFTKAFVPMQVCFTDLSLHQLSFSCKYFVTAKSGQDPDTHGSAWVWPWIRRGKKLDWVPMRIYNTLFFVQQSEREQFGKGWQHCTQRGCRTQGGRPTRQVQRSPQ
jgi:hypothetical protein